MNTVDEFPSALIAIATSSRYPKIGILNTASILLSTEFGVTVSAFIEVRASSNALNTDMESDSRVMDNLLQFGLEGHSGNGFSELGMFNVGLQPVIRITKKAVMIK